MAVPAHRERVRVMGDGYRLFGVAMKVEGGYGEFVHVFPAAALKKIESDGKQGRFL